MATPRVALLERLASGAQERSIAEDRSAVMRSVLANLACILNARSGSAPAQMDLGLPSPHEMLQGFPATLPRALTDIRACIAAYEPRLSRVAVRHIPGEPGDRAIRFQITAVLMGEDAPLTLTTAFASDGRIRVD